MTIPNRGLSGQPSLPYTDFRSYAGADIFLDLTFLDHSGYPIIPTSFGYRVDDLTNAVNVIPWTPVVVTTSSFVLQIPGSLLKLTHYWQGSEIFQIKMNMQYVDTVTGTSASAPAINVLELIAIQTPFSE